MNFLQPAYLWALAALAVPLAIHLLSRKEGKTIRMGSLRHVRETPTRQFRSIRLNEYLLLALRMIVLFLLTFFVAGWYLSDLKDSRRWMIVEPGLENRSELTALFDSLEASGYTWAWLAPGFPFRNERPGRALDYAARLEELQKLAVEEAVVVATNRLSGYFGPRVSLPGNVRWIDVPVVPNEGEISRIRTSADSVRVRKGSFEATTTKFSTIRTAGKEGRIRDTVRVTVAFDPGFETERDVLNTIFTVLQRRSTDVLAFSSQPAGKADFTKADWLVWLSETPVPASSSAVIYFDAGAGLPILDQTGRARFRITMRLNSEVAISHNLALHLMRLLVPDSQAEAAADSLDSRTLPTQLAFGKATQGKRASLIESGNEASTRYLVLTLLFFLVLERIIAYRRNQ